MDEIHKSRRDLIREIAELKELLSDKHKSQEYSPGLSLISSDILNRNEVLLAESQKLSRTGSWYFDLITRVLTWSDEVYRIFGISHDDFKETYESFIGFVHPDDIVLVDESYNNSIREEKDSYEIEHRVIQKDSGEVRNVLERCINIRSAEGTIVASLGIVQDITGIRHAQDELKETNRKLNVLLNNLNGAAYRCKNDPEWTMEFISREIAELAGYQPEELIGNSVISYNSIVFGEDREKVRSTVRA